MTLLVVEEWVGEIHDVLVAVDVGHSRKAEEEMEEQSSIDGRPWRHPRSNHKTIYIQDWSLIKWPISNGSYPDPYLSIKPFALTVLCDFFPLTLYSNSSHDH